MKTRHFFACVLLFTGSTARAQWTNSGDNYTTGKVGIGTSAPTEALHVNGLIKIERANGSDNNSPGIIHIANDDFNYDGEYINHYGFGFHGYQDGSSQFTDPPNTYVSGYFGVDLFTGGINRLRISRQGSIGIGTVTPGAKLDVWGAVRASSAADRYLMMWNSGDGNGYINYQGAGAGSRFGIQLNGSSKLSVLENGKVGIGTTTPDSELTVKGTIHTQEVKVDLAGAVAPDYVFEEDYALPALSETEAYVKSNKHLPGIPSASEMEENGIDLKEMNLKLLQRWRS